MHPVCRYSARAACAAAQKHDDGVRLLVRTLPSTEPLTASMAEKWSPELAAEGATGKVMAVVGFECDQVIRTREGDVSVPITWAYNHHFEHHLTGKHGVLLNKNPLEVRRIRLPRLDEVADTPTPSTRPPSLPGPPPRIQARNKGPLGAPQGAP